eukprot:2726249-Amphidinium_carterae.1
MQGVLDGEVCKQCEPGTIFDVGSASCIVCPLGSYQNESGRTSCESSPAGFYILDVTHPSDIRKCPVGSACPVQGTLAPLPCNEGNFAETTGMSACALCERGRYQTEQGSSACHFCCNSFAGGTTADKGASSEEECVCVEGTYRGFDDSIGCLPCPVGMGCLLGSDVRHVPSYSSSNLAPINHSGLVKPYPCAELGYMTLTSDPLVAYQCLERDADICPGGAPGTCGPNRALDVIACGECSEDSYQYSGQSRCLTCGSFSWLPAALVSIAAFAACVLTTVVTNVTLQATPAASMTMSAVVGLIVTSSQILHILLRMDIAWGGFFTSLASLFGLLSLQSRLLKVGCVLGNNPVTTYMLGQALAPTCIPVVALILRFEKYLLPKIARSTSLHVPLGSTRSSQWKTITHH